MNNTTNDKNPACCISATREEKTENLINRIDELIQKARSEGEAFGFKKASEYFASTAEKQIKAAEDSITIGALCEKIRETAALVRVLDHYTNELPPAVNDKMENFLVSFMRIKDMMDELNAMGDIISKMNSIENMTLVPRICID